MSPKIKIDFNGFSHLFFFFLRERGREREGQREVDKKHLPQHSHYLHNPFSWYCPLHFYSPFNSVFDPFFFGYLMLGLVWVGRKTKVNTMTSASSWGLQLFFLKFCHSKNAYNSFLHIKIRGRISPGQNWSINKTKKDAVYFFLAYLTEF